ncbi:holin family protein [Paracoccus albus]|uniref:holin family protein n=1 Tax=Paracoccus albus TaxID=3017784 RepID=UPI0022F12D28|nr:holin family protein [Paracoccus albus]WBU60859.1 holin family protein [Paracoccus albus]
MGMIERFIGIGGTARTVSDAAVNVTDAFRENATRRMELDEAGYHHAMTQFSAEFSAQRCGWFDSLINGINRLPRPLMTFGTIGLFAYAMTEPAGFARRMSGLQAVPEPLWWLLGAIVSFYFGAREAHYFRGRGARLKRADSVPFLRRKAGPVSAHAAKAGQIAFPDNAALQDWADGRALT